MAKVKGNIPQDGLEWLDLGLVNFESLDQIRNLIGACWFTSDLWAFPEMFGAFQCLQGWAPNDDMMGVIPFPGCKWPTGSDIILN